VVTLAGNLFSQGVDPNLNFTNMPYICALYKKFTGMPIYPRQPYAGELVFAAFSGSHQDAIAKGMAWRKEKNLSKWTVPYLPIDPQDVGRQYDKDVIRINSQSGKGGVGYVLQTTYGIHMPATMKEDFSYLVKDISDKAHKELGYHEIYDIFVQHYLENRAVFDVIKCTFAQTKEGIEATVLVQSAGETHQISGKGNGRLDAFSNAMKAYTGYPFTITGYEQHALSDGSGAKAISYIGVEHQGHVYWGAGINEDIITASYKALTSALNNLYGMK
jgi:2-isopropylmalate synthase